MKNIAKINLNKRPITIVLASLCLALVLCLIVPWYRLSQYDYSHVTASNPTPIHTISLVSPLSFTMVRHVPLALLAVVFSSINILMLISDFYIIDLSHRRIVRIASVILFVICLFLTIASWIIMINIA